MASHEQKRQWKATLENSGYDLNGIVLTNENFMKAVYSELGIGEEDFPKQSRVVSFLKKFQEQQQESEKDGIQNGRFFTKMGDVWGVDFQKYEESHWVALQRSYPDADDDPKPIKVSVRRKDSSGNRSVTSSIDPYSATIDKINSDNDGPAKTASTRTESDVSTTNEKKIWPIDISGENSFNPNIYQVAHLLPAGQKELEEWFGVGAAVLGIPRDASTETKLMATRGVKRKKDKSGQETDVDAKLEAAAPDPHAVRIAEATNTEPRKKIQKERFEHTGVVHFVSNKIRMKNQGAYFDGKTPLSLLVPCMTLEQARGWRGETYKAVFWPGFRMITLLQKNTIQTFQISKSRLMLKQALRQNVSTIGM